MNIKGGALEFDIIANNGQLNSALEESKRRIQGFSDATVEGGAKMEVAYKKASDSIEKAFKDIDTAANIHKEAISSLEKEYTELGEAAAAAFMKGTAKGDEEYRALTQKQEAIKQEINTRKNLLTEIEATADALGKEEQKLIANKAATEKNANTQTSMRTRIRELREEMMLLVDQGIDEQSEAYKKLTAELGRLTDIQMDVQQQARFLANDEAAFQGVIAGLSGIAGAAAVAQGAIGLLFDGENEELQKIMLKVQALTAITVGMQQVAQAVNKDSYFQLVTVEGIRNWWAEVVEKANIYQSTIEGVAETSETISGAISETAEALSGAIETITETADTVAEAANTVVQNANTAAETANTTATTANTAAQSANTAAVGTNTAATAGNTVATGAQTAAAGAGTVANIGLAGAFRLVGAAIKSIPVGWIIAGIAALVAVVSHFVGKAREAKKASEEFRKEVSKSASEQITSLMKLSEQWKQLGSDLNAQKKFLIENGDEIKKLTGKTLDLSQAEDLFIKNTGKFIEALILRARAEAQYKEVQEKTSNLADIDQQIDEEYNKLLAKGGTIDGKSVDKDTGKLMLNYTSQRMQELKAQRRTALKETETFLSEFIRLSDSEKKILQDLGLSSVDAVEGSIAAVEKALSGLKDKYKNAATDLERSDLKKQIKVQEDLLNKLEGGKGSGGNKKTTDPFTEGLEEKKKAYQEYYKWVNAGLENEAKIEFSETLKGGNTYLEYLKKLKEDTELTKEQIHRITNEIAEETNETIINKFKESIQNQISNAATVLEMLDIIKQKRDEIKDEDPLKNEKENIINEADKDLLKKQREETRALMEEYGSYLDKKTTLHKQYLDDKQLLEIKQEKALTEEEKERIDRAIEYRKEKYDEDLQNLLRVGTEANIKMIELARDNTLLEISNKKYAFEADKQKEMIEVQKKAIQSTITELEKLNEEAPTDELAMDIERAKLELKELNAELEKTDAQKLHELAGYFSQVADGLGSLLGEVLGDEDLAQLAGWLGDAAEGAANLAAGLMSGNPQAIVDGAMKLANVVKDVISANKEANKEIAEFRNNLAQMAVEYSIALINVLKDVKSINDSIFSTNTANALTQGMKGYNEAIAKQNELTKQLGDTTVKTGVKKKKFLGITYGTKDVYDNLLKAYPDLIQADGELNRELADTLLKSGNLSKEAQRTIENIIAAEDAAVAAMDSVNTILTNLSGSIGDDLRDALVDAFTNGTDAAESFGKSVSKIMENIISQMVFNAVFGEMLSDLEEDMKKSYDKGGDQNITDDIGRFFQSYGKGVEEFNKALQEAQKEAERYGIDVFKGDSDPTTSLSGAIKGASQESIDLLAGQTNAVRVNQVEGNEIMRNQLLHLASIDAKVGVSNTYLASIDSKLSNNNSDPLRAQGIID